MAVGIFSFIKLYRQVHTQPCIACYFFLYNLTTNRSYVCCITSVQPVFVQVLHPVYGYIRREAESSVNEYISKCYVESIMPFQKNPTINHQTKCPCAFFHINCISIRFCILSSDKRGRLVGRFGFGLFGNLYVICVCVGRDMWKNDRKKTNICECYYTIYTIHI